MMYFKGNKSPWLDFLERESKAILPMSRDFMACFKIPTSMKRDTSSSKFTAISRQVSHASLLGFSAAYCWGALVDESGMIGTQIRKMQ
jgi:hypothetical protein